MGPKAPNVQRFARNHELLLAGKVPVLTTLATEYAVFNGWFSSIPGPTICNRAFAHYGTSFGNVDMNMFLVTDADRAKIPTIYETADGGRTQRQALLLRPAKFDDGDREPDQRPELLRRVQRLCR